MAATKTEHVTEEGRALLTEAERGVLAGESDATDNYEYKVKSLVRLRIQRQFEDDVEVLREHFPEAYELVREAACDE